MSEERVMDNVSGGIWGSYPPRRKVKRLNKKEDTNETNDAGSKEKVSETVREREEGS